MIGAMDSSPVPLPPESPSIPATRSLHRLQRRARIAARVNFGITRQVRQSLKWDSLTGALTGLYMGMTAPFFIKIGRDMLHASPTAISLMFAAPFIGNLFSPFWARQMEGREKLPFCVGSWAMARILLLIMPFALTGNSFVLLIALLQIIGTVSAPAYTSIMRDIYPDESRGRLMGYARVAVQSMAFISTLLVGRLLDHGVSYTILFPIAGIFGITAAMTFRNVRPLSSSPVPLAGVEKEAMLPFLRQTFSILLYNRPYRWFALSVFVYGFANLMLIPLYGLYQVDVLKISGTQIANIANVAALSAIVGSFFWGRFMDKNGPAFTVLCGICLIAAMPIVYFFAPTPEALLFAGALSGFGFSGIDLSYLASILLYAERHKTAQYQSLHALLLGVRGVLAPLLGIPLIHTFGYKPVFVMGFGIMMLGGVLQALAIRDART